MSLNSEWRTRIELWIKALDRITYAKVAKVELEAFFTYDQLTPQEAATGPFNPISPGTRWGAKWEYAWFRTHVRVPMELEGKRIVLNCGQRTPQFSNNDLYGEWRIFSNGIEVGSRDWAHVYLPLTISARGGDEFSLLAEAFGGPTRAGGGGGPALNGIPTIPDPAAKQRLLPEVAFGLWQEEVFQLRIDAQTLLELRDQLDPNSLRRAEIDSGLRDFTLIADPELPWPEMEETIGLARERLRPLLECRNGSTAPTLFCVGHSHLDVVYQWPLKETERKVARTFTNQLALMESYPEYRYLQSMPVLYEIAQRLHPAIYARVKEAVRRGQWVPEGGTWTEPDCNLPNGESLIRQFLYGKRFFQEEFGIESIFCWAPDIFGYCGALPQIMAGCGIKYFGSSKIFCVFAADGAPFPYSTFWWEGIDGTRILTHFVADYGITTNPAKIAEQWSRNPQKDGIRARMAVYGHSDGGGGSERDHLEFLRRQVELEGAPRCKHATPIDFFAFQEAQPETLPIYSGEIYLAAHRGTYTTQAAIKRGNRQCETMLREAEIWSVAAQVLKGLEYPRTALEQTWKKVLFNQFHDILPGSCIERAAAEATQLYTDAFEDSTGFVRRATSTLCPEASFAGALTAFNSLSWPRTELVPLAQVPSGAVTQDIGGVPHVEIALPSCGWETVEAALVRQMSGPIPTVKSACHFDNGLLRLHLDRLGRIVSCFDMEADRELAAAPLNDFSLFRDTPRVCDAWEIEPHYLMQPVKLTEEASVELVSEGPLATVIRVRRRLHRSTLDQKIWLRRNSRRIDFITRIHWAETHKLLKVHFPLALFSREAIHEIQFGHVKRPTHRSRQTDQDQFEVCQYRWSALAEENRGAAILNDCKHGISAEENTLSLTLLKAPQAPDMHADLGDHEFTYSLFLWNGSFTESGLIREAAQLNSPIQLHGGSGGNASLFRIDTEAVILDTIKLAEDGSGDIILRFYESLKTTQRCRVDVGFPIRKIFETDMLEQRGKELQAEPLMLSFRPFEIKTIRIEPTS